MGKFKAKSWRQLRYRTAREYLIVEMIIEGDDKESSQTVRSYENGYHASDHERRLRTYDNLDLLIIVLSRPPGLITPCRF